MWFKRGLVDFLESLCGVIDHLPGGGRDVDGKWWWSWRNSGMGCWLLHLADRSSTLDEKWGTGVWCVVASSDEEETS